MMKLKKKGAEMSTSTMIYIVLGLIVLGIAIYLLFFKGVKPAESTLSTTLLEERLSLCKAKGMLANTRGVAYKDCDNDGYPDDCELCLGGDDGIDDNLNGMPNGCELKDKIYTKKDALSKICADAGGTWNEDKEQCKLVAYKDCPPAKHS